MENSILLFKDEKADQNFPIRNFIETFEKKNIKFTLFR